MTPEQSRAARGWLDWSQDELATRSRVALSTVRDFEKGRRTPIANNLDAMRRALEAAGIAFTDRPAGIASVKSDPQAD
ncbi:helix-turn-helix domain-containing protein [Methylobacterium brachiatum]|uniref:helix-turn-helix domain-containing protein n=1 Tax=Methylobacterium brachiatum TaxID=269660 RepID=UPI000EFDAA90|nr:helix-turn-helix transcriptional regulator [Methylobacterium brachiatum]AYO82231.1 XRE family transcriptional regulator [Methylobacterium brachiatum]